MRTTITLSDETQVFASHYAQARGLTLSAAIDELIQKRPAWGHSSKSRVGVM